MAPPGVIYQHLSRLALDSLPVSYKPLTAYIQLAGATAGLQFPGPEKQLGVVPTECSQEPEKHFKAQCAPCTTCLQAL